MRIEKAQTLLTEGAYDCSGLEKAADFFNGLAIRMWGERKVTALTKDQNEVTLWI